MTRTTVTTQTMPSFVLRGVGHWSLAVLYIIAAIRYWTPLALVYIYSVNVVAELGVTMNDRLRLVN